jgi:hypothetical protein
LTGSTKLVALFETGIGVFVAEVCDSRELLASEFGTSTAAWHLGQRILLPAKAHLTRSFCPQAQENRIKPSAGGASAFESPLESDFRVGGTRVDSPAFMTDVVDRSITALSVEGGASFVELESMYDFEDTVCGTNPAGRRRACPHPAQ